MCFFPPAAKILYSQAMIVALKYFFSFLTSFFIMLSYIYTYVYRLVERARFRQQEVDRSSNYMTTSIFDCQGELRKRFLGQVSAASMQERDNLRQWRRIIQLNTHPRSVNYMYMQMCSRHWKLATVIFCLHAMEIFLNPLLPSLVCIVKKPHKCYTYVY